MPSLYLRLVISQPGNVGSPPPENWQASVLDRSTEAKATKHMMTATCLEQLQNLDGVPYLDYTAAELILAHHANSVVGEGSMARGSFLLWRPDVASHECKWFARGNAALRRGFTPVVLSYIDDSSHSYIGTSRNLPMASMMENAKQHPETTLHKLLWRIGGEHGFTCVPATLWQKYHGGFVTTREPWRCNDVKQLVDEVTALSRVFVSALVRSYAFANVRMRVCVRACVRACVRDLLATGQHAERAPSRLACKPVIQTRRATYSAVSTSFCQRRRSSRRHARLLRAAPFRLARARQRKHANTHAHMRTQRRGLLAPPCWLRRAHFPALRDARCSASRVGMPHALAPIPHALASISLFEVFEALRWRLCAWAVGSERVVGRVGCAVSARMRHTGW